MDIRCAKCGEPWDSYGAAPANCADGHGDMTPEEARRFSKGEGCPCCHFGEVCVSCNGTGKEAYPSYQTGARCCTDGRARGWRPSRDTAQFRAGETYVGYSPNVKHVEDPKRWRTEIDGKPYEPKIEHHQTRDGTVAEMWIVCPTCDGKGEHLENCPTCKGTGSPAASLQTEDEQAEAQLDAARDAIDASDEEPIGILQKRGIPGA